MSVKIAPSPRQQFEDANGLPYSGAKLFTYVAGSTTKQTTYTTSVGDVANSNPIVLDSAGRTPYGLWLTAGQTYKFVLAPSTDTDPPTSPIFTEDNIAGVNDTSVSTSQWIASGLTPTYIGAAQFSVVGDQTTELHVNRRLKLTVSAGTVYGKISVSAYTTVTTVTVVLDSGVLDSGLSAIEWSVLSANNSAVPAQLRGTGFSGLVNFAAGADIASDATIDLTAATGNSPRITGTTATSAVTMNTGQQMIVIADGAWPLTYHATTNKIITGANYTCSAGDIIIFHKDLSGVVHSLPIARPTGDSTKNFTAANLTLLGTTFTVGNQTSWKGIINGTGANRNWQIDLAALTASGYLGITPSTANGGTTFTTPLVQISDGTVTELGLIVNGSIRPLSTAGIRGTVTNDSVVAGGVGEIISSAVGTTSAPTSTEFGDLTSIPLTAGHWVIGCCANAARDNATLTGACIIGVGTAPGNNNDGLTLGDTRLDFEPPTATYSTSASIPLVEKKLTGATTIYLKMYASYSAGTPSFRGRITAQRIR